MSVKKELSCSESTLVQTSREPVHTTGWMTLNDFTALGLHVFTRKIRRRVDLEEWFSNLGAHWDHLGISEKKKKIDV